MNGDISNKQRAFVTSACNAWVICDSKSHPGFKYYFNTFSGQSVWNLSPEEIEKAKKHTKGLPISEIEKCPEPAVDPPMDRNLIPPRAAAPRNFNEPFLRQIPNVYPMGLSMPSMPGISNMSGLNPCIWSNPPNAAPTPIIYVAYPQMNFPHTQEYPQNFPTHINQAPNSLSQEYNNSRNDTFNSTNRMGDTINQNRLANMQINTQQTNSWNCNSPDLRQKLMRKRSKSVCK